jgi:hypothetical protein
MEVLDVLALVVEELAHNKNWWAVPLVLMCVYLLPYLIKWRYCDHICASRPDFSVRMGQLSNDALLSITHGLGFDHFHEEISTAIVQQAPQSSSEDEVG